MRVYNELIDVVLAGEARVKQYSDVGPLMVKFPGERGEVRAQSTDYVLYVGDDVVGVVGGAFLDSLREDKDELLEEEFVTGTHVEATLMSVRNTPLKNEPAVLKQGGVVLAEGRTDAEALVHFNVLPGTYAIGPKDPTHGPDVAVEAVLEAPAEGALGAPPPLDTGTRRGEENPNRFDVTGMPDPNGAYDSRGQLLEPEQRR